MIVTKKRVLKFVHLNALGVYFLVTLNAPALIQARIIAPRRLIEPIIIDNCLIRPYYRLAEFHLHVFYR